MDILPLFQRCINDIDDYLEYPYKSHSKEKIRNIIMEYIDNLTKEIEKEN